MLKYQVRPKPNISYTAVNPSTSHQPVHKTIINIQPEPKYVPADSKSVSSVQSFDSSTESATSGRISALRTRTISLSSLSSIDSSESSEWGHFKIYTSLIKADTDYKTIKISSQTTTKTVIDTMLTKFRMFSKDPNLYCLVMEIRTIQAGSIVITPLVLDNSSKPLELQRCHPTDMSSFYMKMAADGVLVKIFDFQINSESNYKSILLSTNTTTDEAITLLAQMLKIDRNIDSYRLFVSDRANEAEIPGQIYLASLYLSLKPNQKILIRRC
uniref:Ras-associating domain-containing protein n=1 Tax=Rhabditophanes sp. KR3021 TaxID=114890 RepID=A0AC35TLJ3_9BILA